MNGNTIYHGLEPEDRDEPEFDVDFETLCPACKSACLEYKGEAYDDDHHQGSAWRCDECGATFTDEDIINGDF